MFIVVLFTIAKIQKQRKCPLMDEWIKNTHTHTHTHTQRNITQSQKKNEILPFATTWMKLEGIMLSEIYQAEKDKYHMISLICEI